MSRSSAKPPSAWIDGYRNKLLAAKDMSTAGERGMDETAARRQAGELLHEAVECLLKAAHAKDPQFEGDPREYGHDTVRLAQDLDVDLADFKSTFVSLKGFYGHGYPGNPSPKPSNLEKYFENTEEIHSRIQNRYF